MNEEQLVKSIQLPRSTYVLRTFPYNKIEPQLNTAQKRVISENVVSRGIRILAIISPNNTNIPKFEDDTVRFEEIHFYCIEIQELKKAVDVYKVFAQIMPYPLVILFTDGEQTCWVMASHIKQKQTHLLAIEKIYTFNETIPEEVEKQLSFSEMDNVNLKSLYYSWIEQLLKIELKCKYGIERNISIKDNILEKLKHLDSQIEQLVGQAKREKQMNKRIALQVEANKLKNIKQAIIEKEQ
ncbi:MULTISPECIES: DUF4391 domain-containing protein [Bacillus]|jgi:hypothetical protein|uniref:DUF4391 domain-containing protein n=1 Tax=Bacillus TaxID=1386 RepID=UPI000BFA09CE|nr:MULTISPECIES: DUF4391 domain-containing protein [Bacillus]MED4306643.1 DUF4391 domain-containing protein [Bacillus licheniformis]MED4373977.1 DUF4391 domain-containing protein [Bacillus licheniformis]MED4549329.1 DUF4391 domain-containing protein [Bacillus licheniformis]